MNWQEYRNNDRLEQEQLEICRALIEDATPDTVLWLQASPSAEERDHILAIQGLLAELARVVQRRMDRRKEVKDDWKWSETVGEVLSRLEKAAELRGNIVGKGLVRLPKLLPRELLGAKAHGITQSTGIIPGQFQGSRPEEHARTLLGRKPTEVPASPPTYFPRDLWPQTNVILLEARRKFPHQAQTLELCKHITSEMTPLFYEAVNAGRMKADAVLCEGHGGMEDLLRFLLVHNDDGPHTGFGLSDQAYTLGKRVRQSDEWFALARAIADAQHDIIGAVQLRTDGKQPESLHAQNSKKVAQSLGIKSTNAAGGNARETCLRPILDARGFSVHDWAKAAKVDFHTANDYLNGETEPHPSTLKKLADALGVKVANLPK
jgi:hypothetical protein